jgi:phospholipid/cholesterol/gamma-HCH transport system substrate-binding protein
MSEKRLAGKVGLFAVLALIVGIILFLIFAKGTSPFTPKYELLLKANTVAGLRKGAAVLLSGVVIGNVVDADVAPGGRGVLIRVSINDKYRIHSDARFVIEQIGFLGDQYVAIYPQENKGELLAPGSIVPLEEPFNFQEIGRSAGELINEFNQTAKILNQSLERASKTLFSEETLTNASATLANFRVVSEKAIVSMDTINAVVQSNSVPIAAAVSNFVHFSADLDKLAGELRETMATNRFELTLAVKNLQTATKVLEGMARDIEAGKGLAGTLVKDAGLQSNVTNLVANLATLSSNLTKYGLLYKPKKPKPAEEEPKVYPGRNPVIPP